MTETANVFMSTTVSRFVVWINRRQVWYNDKNILSYQKRILAQARPREHSPVSVLPKNKQLNVITAVLEGRRCITQQYFFEK